VKHGFETGDGKRVDVETAFKNPEHPFRIAIVCAMWLTGFDVESLSTPCRLRPCTLAGAP
jgi:type I restriction enzyme R subunit